MPKYYCIFEIKYTEAIFIKQHSETVTVWNYQNADCSLRKKIYRVIYYNFRHTFVPYRKVMIVDTNLKLLHKWWHAARRRRIKCLTVFSSVIFCQWNATFDFPTKIWRAENGLRGKERWKCTTWTWRTKKTMGLENAGLENDGQTFSKLWAQLQAWVVTYKGRCFAHQPQPQHYVRR